LSTQLAPEKFVKHLLAHTLERAAILRVETGVAAIMVTNIHDGSTITSWLPLNGRIERDPRSNDPNDTGTNYLAVAFSKIAEMMSTGKNSGELKRKSKKGELGYRGGITWQTENFVFYLAFSGGTEKQDLECVERTRVHFDLFLPTFRLML
jgi:hypothetical protein